MRLSELKTGESGTILKVTGHGGFRRRIMEMGFVRGQRVEVILNAPLKDPIEYKIMGYDISLRRSEADMVSRALRQRSHRIPRRGRHRRHHHRAHHHRHPDAADGTRGTGIPGCRVPGRMTVRDDRRSHQHASRTITVALVGNPNSGKTSLFNAISGGHEHVGNYSGVTVGAKIGHRDYRGYRFEVTDLPGTYALSAYTPEERYVRSHIAESTPDVIINSVVASNLERNLYLTTELIDINPRMVVALNMFDELNSSGAELDYDNLGRMLGVPMVPVEARNGKGHRAAARHRDRGIRESGRARAPYPYQHGSRHRRGAAPAQQRHERLSAANCPKPSPPRYYAMKMLEGDAEVEEEPPRMQALPRMGREIRDREAKAHHRSAGRGCRNGLRQPEIRIHTGSAQGDLHPGQARGGFDHGADRHLRDAQAVGIPDLLLPDVVHVLVHVQSGRLSAGVDRCAGGLDGSAVRSTT